MNKMAGLALPRPLNRLQGCLINFVAIFALLIYRKHREISSGRS